MMSPSTLREIMAVEMVDFISWMRPAPKSWETTTLLPMDSPEATATDKNTMGKEEPTAATASSPTNFPTTMVSTMLYSCWNKLPATMGRAKKNSSFRGRPSVRF